MPMHAAVSANSERSRAAFPAVAAEDLLPAYAAGRLGGAAARVVEAHLVHAAAARAEVRLFEAAGGVLLETIEPVPLAEDAWSRLMTRLDAEPG